MRARQRSRSPRSTVGRQQGDDIRDVFRDNLAYARPYVTEAVTNQEARRGVCGMRGGTAAWYRSG